MYVLFLSEINWIGLDVYIVFVYLCVCVILRLYAKADGYIRCISLLCFSASARARGGSAGTQVTVSVNVW